MKVVEKCWFVNALSSAITDPTIDFVTFIGQTGLVFLYIPVGPGVRGRK